MCGIAGIVSSIPLDINQIDAVRSVNRSLVHRGPDDLGFYQEEKVALAMRRLSIIDLQGGAQPLYSEDRSLVLIANGEIYNYVELREELTSLGHRSTSRSDCEVIIHLYEEMGERCVDRLRGMFAFALWDNRRRRLILARDRMGEKPLYLYACGGALLFASELKALLCSTLVPFELDPPAVNLYFHCQYVPEPQTAVKGVRRLPPGHLLVIDTDSWQVRESTYWNLEDAPPLVGDPPLVLREQLEEVSRLVIRADVPVGVALSSGLDSSLVAALAKRHSSQEIHAFTVGYRGNHTGDERRNARKSAEHLGLLFHEVEVDERAMVEDFANLVFWRDEPVADVAGHGYWEVARAAQAAGVPVLLQGQGGDELFWGYPWVRRALQASRRKLAVSPKQRGLTALPAYLKLVGMNGLRRGEVYRWFSSGFGLLGGLQGFLRDHSAPVNQLVFMEETPDYNSACKGISRIYTGAFSEALREEAPADLWCRPLPWDQLETVMTGLVCASYLVSNGVTQGDRLAAAASVEMRLPLLDYRFIETVVGLRKAQSDSGLPPKAWLKEAASGLLPDWVLLQPKRGFTPPVRRWMREIFATWRGQLPDGWLVTHGVLTPSAAQSLSKGKVPPLATASLAFKALVLEVWCRRMSAQ